MTQAVIQLPSALGLHIHIHTKLIHPYTKLRLFPSPCHVQPSHTYAPHMAICVIWIEGGVLVQLQKVTRNLDYLNRQLGHCQS